ncbi:MgtC/SapB family protein, partial [Patescibacteria group bacterium]|nr:MgtC/SapB family protein [Patescibacteria group bacterium]MBU1867968.1 MgtC/SapB family protein [Patescibacteria group bacterium]
MSHLSLPLKFLLSIILGGIVGLERESVHQKIRDPEAFRMGKLGGVRTFALMSLLGATAGYLSVTNNPALFLIITITFFVLICTYYAVKTILVKSA